MRAVNLIPAEARRGAGGAAGKSGGAAYMLLGALAVLVVLVGAWASASRAVSDRSRELATVREQADREQARADKLASYTRFASLREKRVQTVTSLATSRFDWSHALHEVARVIPKNAWLTSMSGTVAPDVQVEGGGQATASLRATAKVPAIELSGCTTSQASVAKMLARMRLIDGVQRVSLAESEKGDSAAGSAGAVPGATGGGASSSDCRAGSDRFPKFALVVFFNPATVGASATPAALGAPPATSVPGAVQPAASTTPAPSTTAPAPAPTAGAPTP